MSKCCFCQSSLASLSATKKRKKLYGSSAEIARTVLESFCQENLQVSLDEIVETADKDVFLCSRCDTELRGVPRHEEELRILKTKISTKVQSLHCTPSAIASATASNSSSLNNSSHSVTRKRPASGPCEDSDMEVERSSDSFSPSVKVKYTIVTSYLLC